MARAHIKGTLLGVCRWHALEQWRIQVLSVERVMKERYPGRDVHEAIEETLRYLESTPLEDLNLLAEPAALEQVRQDFRDTCKSHEHGFRLNVEYAIEVAQMPWLQRWSRSRRLSPTRGDVRVLLDRRIREWMESPVPSASPFKGSRRLWNPFKVRFAANAGELYIAEEKMNLAREWFDRKYAAEFSRCRDYLIEVIESIEMDAAEGARKPPKLEVQVAKFREAALLIDTALSSLGVEEVAETASHLRAAAKHEVPAPDFVALGKEYGAIREANSRSNLDWFTDRWDWENRYWGRFNEVVRAVNASGPEGELGFLYTGDASDVLGPLPPFPVSEPDGMVDPRQLGLATAAVRFAPTLPDSKKDYVAWIERASDVLHLRAALVEAGFVDPTYMQHPFGPPPVAGQDDFDPEWADLRSALITQVVHRFLNDGFELHRWKGQALGRVLSEPLDSVHLYIEWDDPNMRTWPSITHTGGL